MKITLSDTLLNSNSNLPSSFSIKQTRLSYQNNAIAKDYAYIADRKNISYKITFSIENHLPSNYEANIYALEHCSYLSTLETFELKIAESARLKNKKYSISFDDTLLSNFSFSTTNNSTIFNYEFVSTKITFN